ncbi:condensation domain-containing protein [Nocardia brasiliensis]|uniref:condensation domain-containing protein n=1 Tax=Nocardia brasiliensis TaxID=37326 RepID=UPI003D8BB89F
MTDTSGIRWLAGLPVPQWRFWYREQKQPGYRDGIDTFVFRIGGEVSADALDRALRWVIASHSALRTKIIRVGARDTRVEVLAPEATPSVLTVRRIDPDADSAAVRTFAATPFTLAAELPIRALLCTGDNDRHLLAVSVHHTAFDGWSAIILFDALGAAYARVLADRPDPVPAPTDFRASWAEQERLAGPDEQDELLRWGRQLVGVPDLPLPHPESVGTELSSGAVDELWFALPGAAFRNIGSTTPSMVMLAAWARALRTFTGAADFAIGVPVNGRAAESSINTVGCFASAIALRFRHTGDDDPRADLATATTGLLHAMDHQFMPLEQIIRLDPQRDPRRMPFCQAGFVVQTGASVTLTLAGTEVEYLHRPKQESSYELTLEVWSGAEPKGRLWYRTDILTRDRVESLRELWLTELSRCTSALREVQHVRSH